MTKMLNVFKKHTFTFSRSSAKLLQDKSKENDTQICHTQTAEMKRKRENLKQEHHIQSNLNIHDIFSTETIGWRRQWNSIYKMWNCQPRLSYSVKIALKIEGKKRHLQFNKPWRILKWKSALSHIIKHFGKAEEK